MYKNIKKILDQKLKDVKDNPELTSEYYRRVDDVDFELMSIPQLQNLIIGYDAGTIDDKQVDRYKLKIKNNKEG